MGYRPRGTVALTGYFVASTPWSGNKTASASWARSQGSTYLSGGVLDSGGGAAQNDEFTEDHQFQAGTYKVAVIHSKVSSWGIDSVQFAGVTVASIDGYAAGATNNNYTEVTGIAVTAGLKVVKHLMATKNASSSGYRFDPNSWAAIRTAA